MIDDMVALLGKEQVDDDRKKAYCEKEFDKADDEIKELSSTVADIGAAIEEAKETTATTQEEADVITAGIVELDRNVASATMQRKTEHAEYTETLSANNAAIQLIEMAKNRMNKFYQPDQYKAPPKKEISEAERIQQNMGGAAALQEQVPDFAQVRAKVHRSQNEAFGPGAKEESTGVIAMMTMLKADVEKEVQEMKFIEKDSQEEYEKMVTAAADKRATDSKAIQEKQAVLAGKEEELHKLTLESKSRKGELMDANMYLADLHKDCDWLIQNYATRKEARANEIDAMNKAKAVLAGADFSLLQMRVRHHLRRR